MQEAIWKSASMIGLLFFMDQKFNMEILVQKGADICLDFNTLSIQNQYQMRLKYTVKYTVTGMFIFKTLPMVDGLFVIY